MKTGDEAASVSEDNKMQWKTSNTTTYPIEPKQNKCEECRGGELERLQQSNWDVQSSLDSGDLSTLSLSTTLFRRHSRCLKIIEKVSVNIASEASYVYILSGPKLVKNAKNGPFWRVFENLKLAVKQCYQTGQF